MNTKINSQKYHLVIWLLIIGILVYSRFVNLVWGLPHPMHPDERNMAIAVMQLECKLPKVEYELPKSLMGEWKPVTSWFKVIGELKKNECFNPHFFAYGQFPLYLGYLLVFVIKFIDQGLKFPIGLNEATLSLRIISAIASVFTAITIIKIVEVIRNIKKDNKENKYKKLSPLSLLITSGIVIFSPFAIQFSHFGTTESLLMFFYSLITYLSLLFIDKKMDLLSFVLKTSFILGLSLATKVSSMIFMTVPLMILFFRRDKHFPYLYFFLTKLFDIFILLLMTFLFSFLFSPHNFINWKDLLGALNYESDVALGKYVVFYTRQFVDTIPVLFQMQKVFPYAMGQGIAITSFFGFLFLSWKDQRYNLLRLTFLAYFLPSAFIFAKWTRFTAPIFPIASIFAILFILTIKDQIDKLKHKNKRIIYYFLSIFYLISIILMFIPGILYLTIYQKSDIRFQATDWINKNIPERSYVLSETANVVDIPIDNKKNLNVVSFNFYDIDENPQLYEDLNNHLEKADYIFVPSRRIFANLNNSYPKLEKYYDDLFNNKLGFIKVAEFSSGLNDENAEETWTVFDHPVIRIFKRI